MISCTTDKGKNSGIYKSRYSLILFFSSTMIDNECYCLRTKPGLFINV